MSALSLFASATTLSLFAVSAVAQSVATGVAYLGPSPICVGDVNGDGRADYSGIVGGMARVYSDLAGSTIAHLTRPSASSVESWFPAGDVNADGRDDLIWRQVGGIATVVSGVDGSTLHTWTDGLTDAFGGADFDGDGHDDPVIRVQNDIVIRSGRTGAILNVSAFVGGLLNITGTFGDANGDGYPDFSYQENFSGQFCLVYGPGFSSTTMGAGTGNHPRAIGDVNNSGTSDYIVRDFNLAVSQVRDGGTSAVLGSIPQNTSSGFVDVMPMGDFNGDGHADFSVLASPTLDIVSGATLTFLGATGVAPRPFGDVNGDGRQDGITGQSGQQVRCYWNDPSLPVASRLVRRGASGTTSTAHKPRVTTRGSCALGKNVFFDVRGQLANGLSLFLIGGALDIDLGPLGAPGNRLYANPDAAMVLLPDANGVAVQSFTMPVSPTLLGTTCSVQAAVVDPAANAFGFAMSNAIDVYTNN